LASTLAQILVGKHKPTLQTNLVSGDNIVVVNAAKVLFIFSFIYETIFKTQHSLRKTKFLYSILFVCSSQVKFTGNKWDTKIYRRHTMWVGGLKEVPARDMLAKHPERILRLAVSGTFISAILLIPTLTSNS
jgi:large subunit ribosomal protein L13